MFHFSLRSALLTTTLLGASLALPCSSVAAGDLESRLAAGEIVLTTRSVAGCELPEATLTAVIDAPPAKVWKIVEDCNSYSRTMVRIAESKEVARNGNVSQCKVTIDMPFPISNLTSIAEATSTAGPPQWKRQWKLVSGDYKRNEGAWTLTAFDAEGTKTRVQYRVLADPNVTVPNYVIRKAQELSLIHI